MFHNYTKIWQRTIEPLDESLDFNFKLEFTISNTTKAYSLYHKESQRFVKEDRLLYVPEEIEKYQEKIRIARINKTTDAISYRELYNTRIKGLIEEVRFPLLHWDSETNMFTYHETIQGNPVTDQCIQQIYNLNIPEMIEAYLLLNLKTLNIFYYPY